jgi:hypothetical protein
MPDGSRPREHYCGIATPPERCQHGTSGPWRLPGHRTMLPVGSRRSVAKAHARGRADLNPTIVLPPKRSSRPASALAQPQNAAGTRCQLRTGRRCVLEQEVALMARLAMFLFVCVLALPTAAHAISSTGQTDRPIHLQRADLRGPRGAGRLGGSRAAGSVDPGVAGELGSGQPGGPRPQWPRAWRTPPRLRCTTRP